MQKGQGGAYWGCSMKEHRKQGEKGANKWG